VGQPYVGEIRAVGFNFVPVGWASCNGSLLSISEYETLFVLIGTTFGGDGVQTFGLPDLRGRTPVHQGAGFVIGQLAGTENVSLTIQTLAAHRHPITAQNGDGNTGSPSGAVFATSTVDQYGPVANGTSASGPILAQTGSNLPHNNLQPYLCVNYIISLFGVFPSQN
jgi:microcystin-dependent protein